MCADWCAQQMAEGKSDQQIKDFLGGALWRFHPDEAAAADQYLALWLAPFLVLGAGGAVAAVVIKRAAARKA